MSKLGQWLFAIAAAFLVFTFGFRLVYGGFHPAMWGTLGVTVVSLVVALLREWRALVRFFTLRTTKHGMNMGVLILTVLIALFCLNLLSVRYETKWDWTSEKLNSLSDQSVKAAKALKADTDLVLLYRQDESQGENIQKNVRDISSMYMGVNPRIHFVAYDVIQHPEMAERYEFNSGAYAFYAAQGETHIKIDQPTEEGISKILLRFGRDKKKVVYFIAGHGERDVDARDEDGMSEFKQDLSNIYDVKTLKLYDSKNTVPEDAAVVVIARPMQEFLEAELAGLKLYTKRGGHYLMALDPGFKNGMARVTKTMGVEFGNNYILDLRSQVIKGGPATVLGTNFDPTSEITRAFQNGSFTIFHVASALQRAPDLPPSLHVANLIQTDARAMSVERLQEQVTYQPNGPHTIAVESHGRLDGQDKAYSENGPEFSAVIVGDSDFLSNRLFKSNLNRDFALNAMSWLSQDKDLISIRPKEPKGTKLEVTNQSYKLYLLLFLLPLPVLLFAAGGFVFWRRKAA